MMTYMYFFILHLALLFFYGIFGMTLLPELSREPGKRDTYFLFSPLIGIAAWLALTVGIGTMLPYNAFFLGAMLLLALVWIVIRRHSLFTPETSWLWWLSVAIAVVTAFISDRIMPYEIDGGFYFIPSIYDHIKCAIISSISSHGLPPVNPWLADGGQPLPLVYYFGWHAWAAQLPILTGCGAFFTECAMTGFTIAVVLLGLTGLLLGICNRKVRFACTACLLLLCLFDTEYTDLVAAILPKSWMQFFRTKEISGFWNIIDTNLWSPQHCLSASMVILILWLHDILLRSKQAKTSSICAALIGLLAATAVLNSVYAGAFALLLIALMMIIDYCRNRDFREKFNHAFFWQIAAVILSLALTAFYLKFMFTYPPEESPLAFGMMPCFGDISHIWQYPLYFIQFYLYILPMRCGFVYIFGMLAIFWPGVLPRHPMIGFCKRYIVISLLLIFFIHSTFYSNDFGWRFPTAPQLLWAVFAAIFLCRIINWLRGRIKKRWCFAVMVASAATVFIVICSWIQCKNSFTVLKYDSALHQTFARAVPGWKVVQAHTEKDDLVLCNPAGFYEIGKVYQSYQSTNVFFSLYAQRNTPIADLIFAKCYSEFYPQEKLEKLHKKVVEIFEKGNPSKQDADYLADALKTRAIIVTPLDGLWQNPGEIEYRFPMKEETQDYRVYWREK